MKDNALKQAQEMLAEATEQVQQLTIKNKKLRTEVKKVLYRS